MTCRQTIRHPQSLRPPIGPQEELLSQFGLELANAPSLPTLQLPLDSYNPGWDENAAHRGSLQFESFEPNPIEADVCRTSYFEFGAGGSHSLSLIEPSRPHLLGASLDLSEPCCRSRRGSRIHPGLCAPDHLIPACPDGNFRQLKVCCIASPRYTSNKPTNTSSQPPPKRKAVWVWECCQCGVGNIGIHIEQCPECSCARCAYCETTKVQVRSACAEYKYGDDDSVGRLIA